MDKAQTRHINWKLAKCKVRRCLGRVYTSNFEEYTALGRVYTVHNSNFECSDLRLLSHIIRGPKSHTDLRTVNGREYETYRETCKALNFLKNDNHRNNTLEEAILFKNPHQIREFFAILFSTCGLSNSKDLWIKYRNDMSENICINLYAW